MRDEKFTPFASDEEREKFLESVEAKTGEKLNIKEGSKELTERVRFIEKFLEGMSDDVRHLKSRDELTQLRDQTEKLAESERVKEKEYVSCPFCEGVAFPPDKYDACPKCGSEYKNGKWIESEPDVFIRSDKIGKRRCPRCKKFLDWDPVEMTGSWLWDTYKRKDCPECKEKAFIQTGKGWLAMTDEAKKANEDDDSFWGSGFDLEDLIDRYEKEQKKKSPDEKKKDESTWDV